MKTTRHTAATRLPSDGDVALDVSRRLGHSKTSMTTDIYGHALDRAQVRVAAGALIHGMEEDAVTRPERAASREDVAELLTRCRPPHEKNAQYRRNHADHDIAQIEFRHRQGQARCVLALVIVPVHGIRLYRMEPTRATGPRSP